MTHSAHNAVIIQRKIVIGLSGTFARSAQALDERLGN